ncbi:MAG: ADP-ribosylglycohydrolase family protein [Ruminococcus sp.]|nr:ADP-ribosylglycohydrolase family protein [Ruminococcus sp.]
MIGAIIGDIVGSRFEFNNYRKKDFDLFGAGCFATDDSIMSLAVAKAVLEHKLNGADLGKAAVHYMQEYGRPYPDCGFGGNFWHWIYSDNPKPYNSFGNGAAMRVSACAYAADTLEEALAMSDAVTVVSHNHPEGIKGARAVTAAIYLAKTGATIPQINRHIVTNYYPLEFYIDEIRPWYRFNETCQDTVPEAIEAFLESESFEDALRTAISVGGDSDTLAAITCSIAEAYYGVPQALYDKALTYLDERLTPLLHAFEQQYGTNIEKSGGNANDI